MTNTDTITARSGYDKCVAAIELAVKDVLLDQPGIQASVDEIWVDMAAVILMDASERVAREVCRCEIGYVPQSLERLWILRRREQAERQKAAERERNRVKAAAKRAALEAEDLAAAESLKASRCPRCFTLPAANGACMC